MFKRKLSPHYPEMLALVDSLYKKYPEGFYVRAKDTIKARHITVKYIGRYIRHPAIASSRIISFDDNHVSFYYIDYETKQKIYKTMELDEFITALIQHIPNTQFKVIRYYGAYSRTSSKIYRKIMGMESMVQEILTKFGFFRQKNTPICDVCGFQTICVWYSGGGRPPDQNPQKELTHWTEISPTV